MTSWVERALALGLFLTALGCVYNTPCPLTPATQSAHEARRLDTPELAAALFLPSQPNPNGARR